jgi:hypothetical protein
LYLILCSSTDLPALWACEGLRAAGIGPLTVITDETLSTAVRWEHRVGSGGSTVSFTTPGGATLTDGAIRGVVNRLIAPPQQILNCVAPADRDYALQEMTAFHLSWIHALRCPVLNRPTPQGLAGRWFHGSEAAIMANAAGFATPAYKQSDTDGAEAGYGSLAPPDAALSQVVVLDDEVFGANLPPRVRDQCTSFARLSQTRLLGIDLFRTPESDWTFACATPLPNLPLGGPPLLEKLARTLHNGDVP